MGGESLFPFVFVSPKFSKKEQVLIFGHSTNRIPAQVSVAHSKDLKLLHLPLAGSSRGSWSKVGVPVHQQPQDQDAQLPNMVA